MIGGDNLKITEAKSELYDLSGYENLKVEWHEGDRMPHT